MCFRCLIFSYQDLVNCCFVLFLCNVVSLYVLCCPVNGSVCFVCCVFVNRLCETIRNVLGCSCHFVVECYGCV